MDMMTLAVGIVIGIAVILLAVFDVFWPFTVSVAIAAIVVWWWAMWPNIAPYIQPVTVAAYFGIACLWVFFKWTRLVERKWREHKQASGNAEKHRPEPPKWSEHSYDFAAYFFYWPIDMAAYILSDMVQEAWRFVSGMVAGSFNRYAQWRFSRER